jgi:hypothetical protein
MPSGARPWLRQLDVSGSMEGNLQLLRDSSGELFKRLRADDAPVALWRDGSQAM